MNVSSNAKPFLKWVGGKQQLLAQFEAYFPSRFERYVEPFVGGGAVFFYLWNSNRLPEKRLLGDHNEELVNVYRVVRDDVATLITLLGVHQQQHNKDYYYQIRQLDRQDIQLTAVERAARTIYLNKTCYNGLYRVNRKKQFNVPVGRYKNPGILQQDTLEVASVALQNVAIEMQDFREIVSFAEPGDFFYFDPPYDPVSKTASFTSYTAGNFSDADQQALAETFKKLTERGCLCMLSNSYTPFTLELYQDFRIEIVQARRAVNSDAKRRGNVSEIIVLNY